MSELLAAPPHLLGLAEWNSLEAPEHENWELVDGGIHVAPKTKPFHSNAAATIYLLLRAAQHEWKVLLDTEIAVESRTPATVRAPDVIGVDPAAYQSNPQNFTPADVRLVVEVVSPGSRRTDYVAKRYDYELAKIHYYWIIDPEQQRVTCLKLDGESYGELPISTGSTIRLTEPVSIEFTWADLT